MKTNTQLDLTGLKCPMPIVHLSRLIKELHDGDQLTAVSDDPVFCLDVEAWCNKTGHELREFQESNGQLVAVIRKRT